MVILLFNLLNTPKKTQEEVIFSDFLTKLEAGQVEEVTIKESEGLISGRLKDGVKFKTFFVPNDPETYKRLRDAKIKTTVKQPDQNPWYVNFFFTWGPIIFIAVSGYSSCARCRAEATRPFPSVSQRRALSLKSP